MNLNTQKVLAGYEPAQLENWFRYNYFNNEIDISGSGVEEYTFKEIRQKADFNFEELDKFPVKDNETVGGLYVRKLIAEHLGTGDPNMVMITNGSNEGLQLAVRSVLSPGDEIITQNPCYHCHDKIAGSMLCHIKKWEFLSKDNFDLDLDDLRQLITEKTKAVVLNFPHNPTGVTVTQDMLDKIVELLREKDIYLIWDSAFQQLTYDTQPLRDPVIDYKKTITVGTFSKAYGAPGLRFGWVVSSENVISACVRQKDYGNLFVSPMIEYIAIKMLENIEKFTFPRLKQAMKNRIISNNWISQSQMGIAWTQPAGGVCGLLRLPENIDDYTFCTDFLEKTKVLLVPGCCFGMKGFVRFGFGGNTEQLIEGLKRLEVFFNDQSFLTSNKMMRA